MDKWEDGEHKNINMEYSSHSVNITNASKSLKKLSFNDNISVLLNRGPMGPKFEKRKNEQLKKNHDKRPVEYR